MIISDKIYIDLNTEKVDPAIYDLLTYSNPDYHQKMNLGLSVWNTPETIKTYQIKNNVLEITRGEALRIKPFISHLQYNFHHPDQPINLQYINSDFDLDEYQSGAVAAIGSKRQGVVHAVTSAGKSLIILKSIVELKQRAVIIVHRKVLMEQFLKDIKKYIRDEKGNPITPGIIGGGKSSIGDITLAIDKSLAKNLHSYSGEFGTAILDECHLAPAATISTILNGINTKYRFGFSGTLRRKDQKEFLIFSTFGAVIYKIGKEELLEKGRVVPVRIKTVETNTQFDWDAAVEGLTDQGHKNPTTGARQLQEKTIALDPTRNAQIIDLVSRLPGKTIVLSRYVEPCYTLQNALKELTGIEAGIITGRDSKEALESYNAMKERDLKVIFATVGCVSTGVSISDLDNIVLISPIYTNELLLKQIVGRLMRTSPGKTHGTLYFLYDQFIFPSWKLSRFLKIVNS